ncbi:MAG: DUF86 domain-containing protein [Alphaproteobacteria bacterium]|nr:DUF86 domain-containing protein [Alphaproteobacteria bacterium]
MLETAEQLLRITAGKTRNDLQGDQILALAMVRLLEVIGEAANQVPADSRQALPEVPWHLLRGMRNRLIHAYFAVDLDHVWGVVDTQLPPMIESLRRAIADKVPNPSDGH